MRTTKLIRKEPEKYIRPAPVPEPERRIERLYDDSGCSADIYTHFMLDDRRVNIHGIEREVEP